MGKAFLALKDGREGGRLRRRVGHGDLRLAMACGCLLPIVFGCHQEDRAASPTAANGVTETGDQRSPTERGPIPKFVDLGPAIDNGEKWLRVLAIQEGVEGAWATGSFDVQRNKLTIETKGVQRFVIDAERVDVNWRKLVIIRIDGHNSELRKRDDPSYRFVRDKYGAWVVDAL